MKQIISIMLFLIVILSFDICSAQERTIFGSVTAFEIIPIVKAEVFVKSSNQTFYTDSLGNFEVLVDLKDKIRISAEGFSSKNIKVKGDVDTLFVDLKIIPRETESAMNSGHINNEDELLFRSKLSALSNDPDYSGYTSVYEILKDKFRSVIVKEGNGTPQLTIGYPSSISGNNSPLIVVDGVVLSNPDLSMINPKDVKKIQVLKPGGESSIYGSEGGNGAIEITTKRGGD